ERTRPANALTRGSAARTRAISERWIVALFWDTITAATFPMLSVTGLAVVTAPGGAGWITVTSVGCGSHPAHASAPAVTTAAAVLTRPARGCVLIIPSSCATGNASVSR